MLAAVSTQLVVATAVITGTMVSAHSNAVLHISTPVPEQTKCLTSQERRVTVCIHHVLVLILIRGMVPMGVNALQVTGILVRQI